jgi:4-diphosphocytidyl-2-C-methyl-D-erythritol kinase
MATYALSLGSDCPFFLNGHPCFATGRGEILQPVNIDLSPYQMIIVNPGIHVSTKEAFSLITPTLPLKNLTEIIKMPIDTWKDQMHNDFEIPVFSHHPAIREIKKAMYTAGAIYAAMSGSGSSVFGLFEKEQLVAMPYKTVFCGELQ